MKWFSQDDPLCLVSCSSLMHWRPGQASSRLLALLAAVLPLLALTGPDHQREDIPRVGIGGLRV